MNGKMPHWNRRAHFSSSGFWEVVELPEIVDTCCLMLSLGRVRLFANPWTVAHQAPLSIGFSRKEYWSGLPFPSPGECSNPGIKPMSPALAGRFLITEPPGNLCLTSPCQKLRVKPIEDVEFPVDSWGPSENLVTNLDVLQGIDDWFREPVFLPSCYDAPNNTRIHLQLLLGVGPGVLKILQEALIQNRLHTRKGNESHPVDPWNFPQIKKRKRQSFA